MKVLNVVTSAYRGTLEEQDDTILWLTQAMRNAGGDVDILLQDNSVNYALEGQDCAGLAFGEWRQTQPPRIAADLARLIAHGANVFIVDEHVRERGLSSCPMVAGLRPVAEGDVAGLMNDYAQVWRW